MVKTALYFIEGPDHGAIRWIRDGAPYEYHVARVHPEYQRSMVKGTQPPEKTHQTGTYTRLAEWKDFETGNRRIIFVWKGWD